MSAEVHSTGEARRLGEVTRRPTAAPGDGQGVSHYLARGGAGRSSCFLEQYTRGDALAAAPEPGRNEPRPCGSGTKFKRCCGRLG